jgi:DNA polymerase III alpha subunit (gram-positive type)
MSKYVALDCETTGLDANVNNLLTATFIILDSELVELDRLNISLKSESYTINAKAMEVNKIDLIKHHNESIDIIEAKNTLINFLKKNKTNFYLTPIGHNCTFDILFIQNSGLLPKEQYNNYFSYNSVDTIVIANFLKMCGKLPERQPVSLSKLSEYYGIQRRAGENDHNFHTSEYDTEMTVKLLKKFVELNIFE